jgi:hypothetical protein
VEGRINLKALWKNPEGSVGSRVVVPHQARNFECEQPLEKLRDENNGNNVIEVKFLLLRPAEGKNYFDALRSKMTNNTVAYDYCG